MVHNGKEHVVPRVVCLVGISAIQGIATTHQAIKQFLVVAFMAQQDQAVVCAHSVLLIPNVFNNSALQLVAIVIPKDIQPMSKSLIIHILHTANAFYPRALHAPQTFSVLQLLIVTLLFKIMLTELLHPELAWEILDFSAPHQVNVDLNIFALAAPACQQTDKSAMESHSIVLQEFVAHTISSTRHV